MVIDERSRDRAQLMLVGAVSIGIVLMGLVVVFNTVLFTDSRTATDPLDEASEAQSFSNQIRKETKELHHWIQDNGASSPNPPSSPYTPGLNNRSQLGNQSYLGNWSRLQALSHANTGPLFVRIRCPDTDSNCNPSSGGTIKVEVIWQSDRFSYRRVMEVEIP